MYKREPRKNAYSFFAKRNETKYMGEGKKMLINLNTVQDNIDNVFGSNNEK